MAYSVQMLRNHPKQAATGELDALAACIDACFDCAETCTACADACLGEDKVDDLVTCIRLNLDCADVCSTTGKILSRQVGRDAEVVRTQLQALMAAVRACAAECDKHAGKHEHCRICAEACRKCEESCRALTQATGG